ncbi:FoF1 ATP synthase subunit gamma [Chakrabartyella piscis]|uniref:F0F1 ATP synthase subunit gamma n=1 Tax=Chakrabartyella piscis TaxID=2918914 RepID=UPI002958DA54|nr:FoF1 ATP synthase subunit gamma [Chakrabartyella piscis]
MNVKAVVKVMNFHALLRVDASRRLSDMYSTMQDELEAMMSIILSNDNLKLDKTLKLPDPKLPVLRIYIASDLGFCGGINTSITAELQKDGGSEKIVLGKKIRKNREVALYLTMDEFESQQALVEQYLKRAVKERKWSAVELVYNHFYNLSSIKPIVKRIYPINLEDLENQSEEDGRKVKNQVDFFIEGDATDVLENMIISFLNYEFKIALASAKASENVMRQNATSESLKKLDEMEEEEIKYNRKMKNQKSFQKTIDSFVKQKSLK